MLAKRLLHSTVGENYSTSTPIMKQLYLIHLLILVSVQTFCIDTLIVDTSKVWSVVYGEYPPTDGVRYTTHSFQFKGDSVINDTFYFKILESYDSSNYNWTFTRQFIRQESSKIFIRDYFGNDRILYDFNLKVGDTITQINMFEQESDWILELIDSIELDNVWYKHYTFGILDCDGCPKDFWVEGIGSLFGVIHPGNLAIDFSTELLCMRKGEDLIYINSEFNSCYIYAVQTEINQIKEFNIFPNPFISFTRIQLNEINPSDIRAIYLVNAYGKKIKEINLIKDYIQLERENLPSGLYFIQLIDKNNRIYSEKLIAL